MNEIKKEHILAAVKEIETEGIRSGRHSSTYDLIHEGKPYPPKLVISIANRFATGTELDSSEFYGGPNKPAFDLLVNEGFEIVKKDSIDKETSNNKMNYKEAYSNWLDTKVPPGSGSKNSYIRAIDLLSDTLGYNIFEENSIEETDLLYEDLIIEQRIEGGKYWNAKSTSYGLKGFYSAAIKTYSDFLRHYLAGNKIIETNNFKDLIYEFDAYIKKSDTILNKFEINLKFFSKTYAAYWDSYKIIGDKLIHYEIIIRNGRISVEIHFENLSIENNILYFNSIELPENAKWIRRRKGYKEIAYKEDFGFETPELIPRMANALLYLEENLGDKLRSIKKAITYNLDINSFMNKTALNQILYGPPGTGKTYNSINKALELIGESIEGKTREEIKTLFEEKVNEGNIVFTTFHQNMSYEDFIEGIKPITVDNQVIYKIENGIFKNLCKKASEKKTSKNFDESYSNFVEEVLNKGSITLETPTHKKKFKVIINSNETAVAIPETEKGTNMGVTKEMSKDYVVNGVIRDWKPYTTSIGEYIKKEYPVEIEDIDNSNKKFVLIIDEINRGNVSKIFGELITLIEESKRTGKPEAITATLPYSKEEFSVPDNVYILGTMNTADRSVEALDTALRRRFDFVEMMPKYDLYKRNEKNYFLNGMFAFDILETVNKRIEVLLGRDHLIGHSFFILDENEKIETKVQSAFFKNIIPLLQEYFYGDYNKIGLVLGSGFVTKTKVENHKELFANSKDFNGNDYVGGDSHNYKIAEFKDNVSFFKALDMLMNKTNDSDKDE